MIGLKVFVKGWSRARPNPSPTTWNKPYATIINKASLQPSNKFIDVLKCRLPLRASLAEPLYSEALHPRYTSVIQANNQCCYGKNER